MSEKIIDNRKIYSYVIREDNAFSIHTSERESSSPYANGHRYFETLVFDYNPIAKTLGDLLYQHLGGSEMHNNIVRALFDDGNLFSLGNEKHDF